MAKKTHHDNDPTPQAHDPEKAADSAGQPPPAAPPGQPIPNMSLDDDEPLVVEEVVEAEVVPVEEAPMVTEAIPLAEDDDVLTAEVVEEAPVETVNKAESDVFLADAVEEEPLETAPASDVIELESASEVIRAEAVLTDEVVGAHPMDSPVFKASPPISGADKAAASGVVVPASAAGDEKTEMVSDQEATADAQAEMAMDQPRAELPATEIGPQASEPVSELPEAAHEAVEEVVVDAGPAPGAEVDEVVFEDDVVEAQPASAVSAVEVEDDVVLEAAPESAVEAVEEIVVEAAPASGVVFDDEIAEAAPASAVEVEEVVAEAAPASGVVFDDEIAEAAPVSAVEVEEVVAEAAPASAVELADEVVESAEAAPESAIEAAEAAPESAIEAVEAAPESAIEAAEAAPESAIEAAEVAPESAIEAAEAGPESAIEAAEAAPESAIEAAEAVLDDEIVEAAPASAIVEDVLLAEEVSSATRKAESVFEEEVLPSASAVSPSVRGPAESDVIAEVFADAVEEPSAIKSPSSAGKKGADSATVFFDEPGGVPGSKAKRSARRKADNLDQTVAFDTSPSGAGKPPESLVEEEDLTPTSEGSAVNLGDMPSRKGSSISGIDPVAEALESGVDIARGGAGKAGGKAPSVEFDELLDDLDGSSETESPIPKGKKDDLEDSTEMDAGVFDNVPAAKEPAKPKKKAAKKDTKPVGQTGDDVDLAALLSDDESEAVTEMGDSAEEAYAAEEIPEIADDDEDAVVAEAEEEPDDAAEPVAAEEDDAISFNDEPVEVAAASSDDDAVSFDSETDVAEAAESDLEAAEAFDEEVEAAGAEEEAEALDEDDLGLLEEDEIPAPKGKAKAKAKAGKKAARDEEEVEAEDDEEEASASKKKGKKGKTIAPPAPAQPSMALRWMGGMFVATLLIVGGAAAAFWFTPYDTVKDATDKLAEQHPNYKKPAPPEKTKLEKARIELEAGRFDAADALLQNAVPAELATRGEARWLAYFKQQSDKKAPLDRKDPKVQQALKDLGDAKNKVLADQIDDTLRASELDIQLKNLLAADEKTKKELESTKVDKEKAETIVKDVKQALVDGKVAPKVEDVDLAMLPKTVKDLGVQKGTLDAINKLLKDGKVDGEGDKGVKEVLDSRKKTEEELAAATKIQDAVNKVLEEAKTKGKNADGVQEIVDARTKVTKDRDDLAATVASAFKELVDGKIVPMNDDPRKQIVEAVKAARKKAESPLAIPLTQLGTSMAGVGTGTGKVVEQAFDLARLFTELGFYKTREPFIQTPQQKLDTYITLLQNRNQKDAKNLAAIQREADWVLSDGAKADAESRGKAYFVQGLAQRNLENFDKAKVDFEQALKAILPLAKVGAWSASAKKAQEELTKPGTYYLPRIEKLESEGNWKAALAETNTALKAMPKEASLFAERGLIRFELVKGQGAKVPPDDRKAIRADADAAAGDNKDPKMAAKGAYLQGLLEEELGNLKKAEDLYRQALKEARTIQPEARADVGAYLNALGNLLLRDRTEEVPAAPAAPAAEEKKVSFAPAPRERVMAFHPWTPLIVTAVIAAQKDEKDDAKSDPKLKEVIDLAHELINSPDTKLKGKGYLMLGQAYVKQGERTEGLKAFSKGLQLLYPGLQTNELNKMIDEHPAFQQPDTSNIANPEMAARYFGDGLHYYWSRQYPLAETQFKQAVKFNDQDARYQYFLGLAQLAQKTKMKRDAAIYSFEQGARLEARGFPTVDRINQSLERIQGQLRQQLNDYRYKAVVPAPEAN